MNKVMKAALGRDTLQPSQILGIYEDAKGAEHPVVRRDLVRLCESHERLRAELQGAEVMLEENRKLISDAHGFITHTLEFWDWTRFPNLQESVEQLRDKLAATLPAEQPREGGAT